LFLFELENSKMANYYELAYLKRQVSCRLFPFSAVSGLLEPFVIESNSATGDPLACASQFDRRQQLAPISSSDAGARILALRA